MIVNTIPNMFPFGQSPACKTLRAPPELSPENDAHPIGRKIRCDIRSFVRCQTQRRAARDLLNIQVQIPTAGAVRSLG